MYANLLVENITMHGDFKLMIKASSRGIRTYEIVAGSMLCLHQL